MSKDFIDMDGPAPKFTGRANFYRVLEKGRTDRAGLIYSDEEAPPEKDWDDNIKEVIEKKKLEVVTKGKKKFFRRIRIRRTKVHYIEGMGYVKCLGGICCTKTQASDRFGLIIVHYRTEKSGDFRKGQTGLDYELRPWLFNEQVAESIWDCNTDFPVLSHDLKIKCIEPKWQKVEIKPSSECLWRNERLGLEEQILKEAALLFDKLPKFLGKESSEEELRSFYGEEVEATTSGVDDATLDDLLGNSKK